MKAPRSPLFVPPLRRPRLWQAWLLAVLLLAAQALGLAHRVAHAPGLAHQTGHPPAAAHAVQASAAHADGHASGHEAGSPDCRLIDQLAHADALCGAASLPPALPRTAAIAPAVPGLALPSRGAAAYLARAPPARA